MRKGVVLGQKKRGKTIPPPPVRLPAVGLASAAGKPAVSEPAALPAAATPESMFPAKRRCQGATRYGDPCRFWASASGDFCYWCEQAGGQRYPLPNPAGEGSKNAPRKASHKRRCQGRTVFGDQCRFWAVGAGDLCLWCLGSGKPVERI